MHFVESAELGFGRWSSSSDMAESSHGGTRSFRRGDSYGSWTVYGNAGAVAKLRDLDVQQKSHNWESPATTLSIGMESLGDSGSVGEVAAQTGNLKKTMSWSHFEGGRTSAPLNIVGPKRKRDTMVGGTERQGSSDFGEHDIVLALGSSPSGTRQALNMALGLGQADSVGSGSGCSPSATSESEGLRKFSASQQDSLKLGLSRSSEDEDAGVFLGLAPAENLLLKKFPAAVVDEGSSSARWRSVMPSLLQTTTTTQQQQQHDVQEAYTEEGEHYPSEGNDVTTPGATDLDTDGYGEEKAPKICKFRGCGKGARGASGLCIAHGGGRRCQRHGCSKGAEGRTAYCKAHGGGRRCQMLGCTKSAEGKTDHCISHGGGRRCLQEGCSKAARGRSGLCIRHGGGKRCTHEGCTKSAEGYSGLCISHGGGRRCQAPGCTKGAQGSTQFCKAHGGGKRCIIEGCGKGAEGSTPLCKGHGGGKRCMFNGCPKSVHGGTQFCVAHGGGKRCAVQGCSKSARGRTAFCVRHGGGKRCKVEGCGKSAQGSTDFCKAHGGGKRCTWGQEGSPYGPAAQATGDSKVAPCDRFARGKLGLCAAHSSMVQEEKEKAAAVAPSGGDVGLPPGMFKNLVSQSSTVTTSNSGGGAAAGGQGYVVSSSVTEKNEAGRLLQEGSSVSNPPHWALRRYPDSSASEIQHFQHQPSHHHHHHQQQHHPQLQAFLGSPSRPLVSAPHASVPNLAAGNQHSFLPEGRVHGGGLIAWLAQRGTGNPNTNTS